MENGKGQMSNVGPARALSIHLTLSIWHLTSPLSDRSPSIQPNDLPRDVRAARHQEVNEVRHILRRAGAGQWHAFEILLAFFLRIIVRPLDDAWRDAVDRDFRRQLAR